MDAVTRIEAVQWLRTAIEDPPLLAAVATRLLSATPPHCGRFVAFSPEGHAIAVAASTVAFTQRRTIPVARATHLSPLRRVAPAEPWTWLGVEEALGLGATRGWVVRWARANGAGQQLAPLDQAELAEIA